MGHIRIHPRLFRNSSKQNSSQHETLRESIDRAYLLVQGRENEYCTPNDDGRRQTIEISSSSSEIGQSNGTIKRYRNAGEPLQIAFNSKYMLDALKVIDSEELFIGFNGADEPDYY